MTSLKILNSLRKILYMDFVTYIYFVSPSYNTSSGLVSSFLYRNSSLFRTLFYIVEQMWR
jgi:hypothetical protein